MRKTLDVQYSAGPVRLLLEKSHLSKFIGLEPPFSFEGQREPAELGAWIFNHAEKRFEIRQKHGDYVPLIFSGHHLGVASVFAFLGKVEHMRYFLNRRTLMTTVDQLEAAFYTAACGGHVGILELLKERYPGLFSEMMTGEYYIAIIKMAVTCGQSDSVTSRLIDWATPDIVTQLKADSKMVKHCPVVPALRLFDVPGQEVKHESEDDEPDGAISDFRQLPIKFTCCLTLCYMPIFFLSQLLSETVLIV